VGTKSDSSTPLYTQIKDHLQVQIQMGAYEVGARLPSERELAQEFAVSRMTARQALRELIQDGLAYSRVGKGTFVSPPKIDQDLRALTSFSEECRQRGMTPASRVLKSALAAADAGVARWLQIPAGAEVAILTRLRLANAKPLAIETAHLDHRLCPGILDKHNFARESLYEVLRQEYGWALVWADQIIEARQPTRDESELLELDRPIPVLSITRVTYDQQDRPIEFVTSVYRGDQYHLHAVLRSTAT
jgi:GntR family transcriptional regulator